MSKGFKDARGKSAGFDTETLLVSLPEPLSRFVEQELKRTGEDFTAFCVRLVKARRQAMKRQGHPPDERPPLKKGCKRN